MAILQCSSCKRDIINNTGCVSFPCPACAGTTIIRCKHCREIVTQYRCHECGFTGPN